MIEPDEDEIYWLARLVRACQAAKLTRFGWKYNPSPEGKARTKKSQAKYRLLHREELNSKKNQWRREDYKLNPEKYRKRNREQYLRRKARGQT